MNSAPSERARLAALLGALEDPARAAALPPDDPLLTAVARHHRLTPLLSITCGNRLAPPLAEAFRRDRLVTAARNLLLEQVAAECLAAFAAAGVPTIVLKGLEYATRLYDGAAGARPTADVDLLVPGEKRRAAFGVLDRLGFEPRAAAPGFDEPDYHEVAWTRSGVEVDLHLALAPLVRCRIDYAAVWSWAEQFQVRGTETRVLSRPHAAVFQSLHMAIDHFDVPAIALVDLTRLLAEPSTVADAEATARTWRCAAPFATARALAEAMLGQRASGRTPAPSLMARRVVSRYGGLTPLSRAEQLMRKFGHFDTVSDAIGYFAVQSRRNLRERLERRVRKRSARARLSL